MSTSSTYSSNKLKEILDNKTQHFIIKCFITAAFEYDRKITEYWLYWYNANKGADEENPQYRFLSSKKMNKKEMAFFMSNLSLYNRDIDSNDGCVWTNKQLGFNKEKVVFKQLKLWY